MRQSVLMARPMRGFRPRGRPTFWSARKWAKSGPCKTAPALRFGVPCDARSPGPRPTHFATLRSDKGARSQFLKRAARAPRAPVLLGGLEGEHPNSQQPQPPTAQPASRSPLGLRLAPLSPAEKRRAWSPCAQRTSSTDSRRLFEQSVATRVRRGAPGPSIAGHPEQREGRGGRGELFAYFLAGQKVGRPPGRNPGTVQRVQRLSAKAVAFPGRSTNS